MYKSFIKGWRSDLSEVFTAHSGFGRSGEMRDRGLMAWPDLFKDRQAPGLVPSLGKEEVSPPSVCWAQPCLCPRDKSGSVITCVVIKSCFRGIIEWFRLEKASKIIKSNHYPALPRPPRVPKCHSNYQTLQVSITRWDSAMQELMPFKQLLWQWGMNFQ